MSWRTDVTEIRRRIRSGDYRGDTTGMAPGHVQANLAILPQSLALEFLIFCLRNPKPCPILDVLEPGQYEPRIAPGADIRTDVPKYRVFRDGELVDEVTDLSDYWSDDLVSFLIGCSYTFENQLMQAGIPMRHQDQGTIVSVYRTNIPCEPAGRFHGPMVVSMRPIAAQRVADAVRITARLPRAHGAPVHIGAPAAIGIHDLSEVDWGSAVELGPADVPVFWACGVTPQTVAQASRPPLMITHASGHMFISDLRDSDLVE